VHDVIVVGAGCVGSYMAGLMAESGLDVLVAEKGCAAGDNVNCSGIIGTEAFDKLSLPRGSIQSYLREIEVFGPAGRSVIYRPKKMWANIVDRAAFDREMAETAKEKGAIYRFGSIVEKVDRDGDGVSVTVRSGTETLMFRAQSCVLATGFGFKFIKEAGLGEIKNYIQGVQLVAKMEDVDRVEIYLGNNVAPGSFAWVVPCGEGWCKVGLLAAKRGGDLIRRLVESPSMNGRMKFWDGEIRASLIPLESLPKTAGDRLLVVGEAAGQVKITTAGGIYYGLLCAKIAAGVLEKAFRVGDFSEGTLREYDAKWRMLLELELRSGKALRKIFSKMSDRHIDSMIHLARADGIVPLVNRYFRFDWHAPLISALMNNQLKSLAG